MRTGADVLETLERRRESWRSPYQLRKEERIARERMKIPVCRNCGVRCSVCAPKFEQRARCCLILALIMKEIPE